MPPVLHVPFPELPRRRAQEVLAGQSRFGVHQRHHILQLVAETEGAAGLVESRPAPQPAAQGLVQQPAVRQHVHGGIGRVHIHRAERAGSNGPHPFERRAGGVRPPEPLDQALRFRRAPADAETKARLPLLAVGQIDGHLDSRAGIQSRPHPAGEPCAPQRRRLRQAFRSCPGTPCDPRLWCAPNRRHRRMRPGRGNSVL